MKMRNLGLDVGDKRTGVALSDPEGTIAFSLTTIAGGSEDANIDGVIKLAGQHEVKRIVIGLPLSLSGEIGPQSRKVLDFASKLSLRIKQSNLGEIEIKMWDERLSTAAAGHLLAESEGIRGKWHNGRKRKKLDRNRSSAAKGRIDVMAAAFILQGYLDSLGDMDQCHTL